jgi:hypothetical protein
MKKKQSYNKLFRAHDELTEVLESLYEAIHNKNATARQEKLMDYLETAVDQTRAAMWILEEA